MRIAVASVSASTVMSSLPAFSCTVRYSGLAPSAWITEIFGSESTTSRRFISRNALPNAELLPRLPPGTMT